jgi:hypothetical protein
MTVPVGGRESSDVKNASIDPVLSRTAPLTRVNDNWMVRDRLLALTGLVR